LRHVLQRAVDKEPEAKPAAQAEKRPPEIPESSAIPKAIPVQEDLPAPVDKAKHDGGVKRQAVAKSESTTSAEPKSDGSPLEHDTYLEQCIDDLTRQLMAAPAKKGASVTPISLAGYKLLIATWEAEAFTKGGDEIASALQKAVAARTILYVCLERQKKREPTDIFVALEIAHLAAEEIRQQVERAKEVRNIDAAVSLAATTKRLLGLIAEGEKLSK